jgi:16S rRNA processing protein RimM
MTVKDHPEQEHSSSSTGSPSSSEPEFLAIGKLRKPHGIRGEIEMEILTSFPERLHKGIIVYVGENYRPIRILDRRRKDQLLLLTLEDYPVREKVAALTNQLVFIRSSGLPKLPEGEYYHHEVLGLDVFDEAGNNLGQLSEILETGANDVYLVRDSSGIEILIPALENVILQVDLENHRMTIRPQEWE